MQQQFEQYIAQQQLFRPDYRLLVAVSAGVDSMLLCELLRTAGYKFAIAHANFQLRSDASDGDAAFVKQYARGHNFDFFEKKFDTSDFAQQQKISIQTAARQLRYEWFETLMDDESFDFLLTAHHADDNLETALHHLARGTGLRGLSAMSAKSNRFTGSFTDRIVRPLLWATKAQILAHAEKIQLEYREDSSNASDKYTRNFIRHHVVPALQQVNPAAVQHSVATLVQLQEMVGLLDFFVGRVRQVVQRTDERGGVVIDRNLSFLITGTNPSAIAPPSSPRGGELPNKASQKSKTAKPKNDEQNSPLSGGLGEAVTNRLLLYELLHPFGFNATQVQDIAKTEHTGAIFQSEKFQLLVNRDTFIIEKKAKPTTRKKPIEINNLHIEKILFGEQYRLEIQLLERSDWTMHETQAYAQLDLDTLSLPFTLRPCYEGDAFEPLGMTGKRQKLSDFFNNNKVSRFDKARTWVLVNADGRIIWVMGQRIADSFKITGLTKRVLLLHKRNDF